MGNPELSLAVKVLNQAKKGLTSVKGSFDKFGSAIKMSSKALAVGVAAAMAAIGVSVIALTKSLKKSIKEVILYGDTVGKMSKRIGFTAEATQQWQHVLEITGSDMGSFEKAIKAMARTIYDAGRGLSTAKDALAALGLSYEELVDLSPEEQFKKLVLALASVENQTKQSGLAQEVFKRAGFGLLPMIRSQRSEIEKLVEEVSDLGLALSETDVKQAEEATDRFLRMGKVVKAVRMKMAAAFLPLINKISDGFLDMWRSFVEKGGFDQLIAKVTTLANFISEKLAPVKGLLFDLLSEDKEKAEAAFQELVSMAKDYGSKAGNAIGIAIGKGIGQALKAAIPALIKYLLSGEGAKAAGGMAKEIAGGLVDGIAAIFGKEDSPIVKTISEGVGKAADVITTGAGGPGGWKKNIERLKGTEALPKQSTSQDKTPQELLELMNRVAVATEETSNKLNMER